ncbi:hypothetical protein THJ013_10190 [Campylobacter jejuni]|nr:hypothetical protein B10525_12130 [Campylobacter jejuni]BEK16031.1 hypothetical protein B10998_11690 [Campylobacter jejuni]BEK26571.1 hypothetical protein B11348_12560 [Campylobacter jejuni]BEK30135.1 hypothetical protein B11399_11820 [Campylobacter jejuni]BEK46514.1 hypothetical protein B11531_13020 [Campylobacter jejuni]
MVDSLKLILAANKALAKLNDKKIFFISFPFVLKDKLSRKIFYCLHSIKPKIYKIVNKTLSDKNL